MQKVETPPEAIAFFGGEEERLPADTWTEKYALRDREGSLLERSYRDSTRRWDTKVGIPAGNHFLFSRDFLPGGRIMFALGNGFFNATHKSCYVIPIEEDSIDGIFTAAKRTAKTYSYGGGVGLSLDKLRHKNAPVNNCAIVSSGAASFMELFSTVTGTMGQHGRRGALMLMLGVTHPDILDFIDMKADVEELWLDVARKTSEDFKDWIDNRRRVKFANVSVKLTDKFMKAVLNNTNFQTEFDGKVVDSYSASELWDRIMTRAWKSAEPGIVFWDHMKRESPSDYYGQKYEIIATNPCQPAWATVLTPYGISTIGSIKTGDTIWSGTKWTTVIDKWSTGVKDVYAYSTSAGTFFGTCSHRVISKGTKVEAHEAETIDIATGPENTDALSPQDIMDGLVLGDGETKRYHDTYSYTFLYIGEDDKDYFDSEVASLILSKAQGYGPCAWKIKTTINNLPRTFDREIPDSYFSAPAGKVRGFLRGLFSANGSVVSNRITLKATSKTLVNQVQLLLSSVGIASYVTTNKETSTTFENGTYTCKESYDLNITSDRKLFGYSIGFLQQYKMDKLTSSYNTIKDSRKSTYDIREVSKISTEEVFDITVEDEAHTYWTGGLLVSNCAEKGLAAFDACCLGSLNLAHITVYPFTKNVYIDWGHLKNLVHYGVEFLDKVNEIEDTEDRYPLPEMREMNRDLRRIGLGVLGLGELFIQLGIKYGSQESIELTDKLFEFIANEAYSHSAELAMRYGPCRVFNWEVHKNVPIISRLKNETREKIEKYGLRNITLLSIAPTGSIAILAQTSSGIEPFYALEYNRKKFCGGEEATTYLYRESVVRRWAAANNVGLDDDYNLKTTLPDYFVTAYDVDWKSRVRLQGIIQKWVDSSISSTVNLPKSATVEDVAEIYMAAWAAGCKGITIYRDGCREGILSEVKEEKKPEPKLPADPAPIKDEDFDPPDTLDVKRLTFRDARDNRVLINLGFDPVTSKPIEISMVHGKTDPELDSISKALGIVASIALQNGVSAERIGRALRGIQAGWARWVKMTVEDSRTRVMSVPDGIAAMLLAFKDGIEPIKAKSTKELPKPETLMGASLCHKCKEITLIQESGCEKCLMCGFSRCN